MVLNGVIIGGGYNTGALRVHVMGDAPALTRLAAPVSWSTLYPEGIPTSGVFFSTALASGIFTTARCARANRAVLFVR